jgi:hypothetical protein
MVIAFTSIFIIPLQLRAVGRTFAGYAGAAPHGKRERPTKPHF